MASHHVLALRVRYAESRDKKQSSMRLLKNQHPCHTRAETTDESLFCTVTHQLPFGAL
jgi:hypothetical protein